MATITNVDAATRLARAILQDIRLYHGETIRSGWIDPAAIDEGRGLYRSRVDASLHDDFERELAAFAQFNGVDLSSQPQPAPSAPTILPIESRSEDVLGSTGDPSGAKSLLGALALILALALAAASFLLR